jgi:hypothetical protein
VNEVSPRPESPLATPFGHPGTSRSVGIVVDVSTPLGFAAVAENAPLGQMGPTMGAGARAENSATPWDRW